MEEKFDYEQDLSAADLQQTEKWQVGAPSALSFESGNSEYVYSPQAQHVQYIPEKDVRTSRRSIPATWQEVLTYYRCYATATSKNPCMNIQYLEFNKFFWYHICTFFFKTVPHTYVYMFLASYAPDKHFFLSKMVPITYGFTFLYILSGLYDVIYYINISSDILDYTLMAISDKNPWNRCDYAKSYFDRSDNITIHCYKIQDFKKKIYETADPPVNLGFTYVSADGSEYFNTAQPFYYTVRSSELAEPIIDHTEITTDFIYFAVLWFIVTILNHKLLYRRCIWKVLNITQWIVNAVYIVVFIHLMLHYVAQTLDNNPKTILDVYPAIQYLLAIMDLDSASESTTAPPIMHILTTRTSKSKTEHKVIGDSSTILFSNTVYFLFKGLLTYRLEKYCGSLAGAPITIIGFSSSCFFYLWPMYFSTMFMGELYTIIFFLLHFVMEFAVCLITYQCLLEAIVCEWRLAKRAFVTGFFFVFGLLLAYFFAFEIPFWYIVSRWLCVLLEIIGIYWLYPVGRLIDDITFYTGVKPSRLRILSLKLVPFYFVAKFYIALVTAAHLELSRTIMLDVVPAAFTSLGACYSIYKYIFKDKKGFRSLFRPDTNWGPEYPVRQMRKEFDSREYIGSQAPRVLSRHMIRRAEARTYTLDIRYDMLPRKSTAPNIEFHIKDEIKKDL